MDSPRRILKQTKQPLGCSGKEGRGCKMEGRMSACERVKGGVAWEDDRVALQDGRSLRWMVAWEERQKEG